MAPYLGLLRGMTREQKQIVVTDEHLAHIMER